jgi:hypothetical protein
MGLLEQVEPTALSVISLSQSLVEQVVEAQLLQVLLVRSLERRVTLFWAPVEMERQVEWELFPLQMASLGPLLPRVAHPAVQESVRQTQERMGAKVVRAASNVWSTLLLGLLEQTSFRMGDPGPLLKQTTSRVEAVAVAEPRMLLSQGWVERGVAPEVVEVAVPLHSTERSPEPAAKARTASWSSRPSSNAEDHRSGNVCRTAKRR